jgi:hypothetical protein
MYCSSSSYSERQTFVAAAAPLVVVADSLAVVVGGIDRALTFHQEPAQVRPFFVVVVQKVKHSAVARGSKSVPTERQ